jgi:hypothetical protein
MVPREPTHVHEAGHATVALALGVGVDRIIHDFAERMCKTEFEPGFAAALQGGTMTPEQAQRGMLISLAGDLYGNWGNSVRDVGRAWRVPYLADPFDDIGWFCRFAKVARQLPTDVPVDEMVALVNETVPLVTDVLRQNESAAKALADELLRRPFGTLDGAEISRIWQENRGTRCPLQARTEL